MLSQCCLKLDVVVVVRSFFTPQTWLNAIYLSPAFGIVSSLTLFSSPPTSTSRVGSAVSLEEKFCRHLGCSSQLPMELWINLTHSATPMSLISIPAAPKAFHLDGIVSSKTLGQEMHSRPQEIPTKASVKLDDKPLYFFNRVIRSLVGKSHSEPIEQLNTENILRYFSFRATDSTYAFLQYGTYFAATNGRFEKWFPRHMNLPRFRIEFFPV